VEGKGVSDDRESALLAYVTERARKRFLLFYTLHILHWNLRACFKLRVHFYTCQL
jgi:hypothetical protein